MRLNNKPRAHSVGLIICVPSHVQTNIVNPAATVQRRGHPKPSPTTCAHAYGSGRNQRAILRDELSHPNPFKEIVKCTLEGEGLMELDGETRVVRRHDVIFIPPGMVHGLHNTGFQDLIFIVVTTPASDDPL